MSRALFKNGMYAQCLADTEASMLQQGTLTERLILQNNKEVCQIMMLYYTGYKNHNESNNGLRSILDKCASVPVWLDVLQTELAVLYNSVSVVCIVHSKLSTRPDDREENLPYQACVQTLLRVYRLIHPQQYSSFKMKLSGHDKHSCYLLMEKCLDRLAVVAGCPSLLWPVSLCCCVMAVWELLLGDTEQARCSLQKLMAILESHAGLETEVGTSLPSLGLYIPFMLDSHTLHPCPDNCLDLCRFLLGVCAFTAGRWDECVLCMRTVQSTDMTDAATYITGVCLMRQEKYNDAVPVLNGLVASTLACTQRQRARIYNHVGNCLSKMDKPHLALQFCKEALSADFGSLSPLYNISLQHRQLGTSDTELQCLHSLVMALRNVSAGTPSTTVTGPACMDLYQLMDLDDDVVTYLLALYTLAQQYRNYGRHEEASKTYLDLMAHLTNDCFTSQEKAPAGLPPILHIYHETVQSLLEASKYTDCVTVCDKVLSCFHSNSSHGNNNTRQNESALTDCDFSNSQSMIENDVSAILCDSSRKRKRIHSQIALDHRTKNMTVYSLPSSKYSLPKSQILGEQYDDSVWLDSLDMDVVTLRCKAKALIKLGDLQAAVDCLQSAVDCVDNYRMKTFQTMACDQSSPPPSKRPRHSETSNNNNNSNATDNPHTAMERSEVDCDGGVERVAKLQSDLYLCLGSTLEEQGQISDALHCYRLAAQLTSGDVKTMYRCAQTLLSTNHPRQAATTWLRFRNIPMSTSHVTLKQQIQSKQNLLRSCITEKTVEDKHLMEMDITCLEYALKYCH